MKNVCVVFGMIACVMCASAEEVIKLPPVRMDRGSGIMDAFKARKSTRAFADRALPDGELGDLLWSANGLNRPDKTTNATGMNKQTIRLYALRKDGAWFYDNKAHALRRVSDADLRPLVAGRQAFAATAPVTVLIAADVSDPLYRAGKWVSLTDYDAGIVSGNIYLFCAAHGLATVCRGTMDIPALKKALKLGENFKLHLNHPVGYPPAEPVAQEKTARPESPLARQFAACDFLRNRQFKKDAKLYIVLFSASWCPPCRNEMPHIAKLYAEKLKADPDVELIHFSCDRDLSRAEAWADEHQVKFPVVKPGQTAPGDVHPRGIPHVYFFKGDGSLLADGHPMRLFKEDVINDYARQAR